MKIHTVSSTESPEFTLLTRSLTRSSVIGLDAEWKPTSGHQSAFPTVSLLQLACRLGTDSADTVVFLLDLLSIPLPSIWDLLRDVFVSPDVLKLGFRFKQDLVYLSSTFSSNGCDPGFDRIAAVLELAAEVCLVAEKMWENGGNLGFSLHFSVSQHPNREFQLEPFLDITNIYNHLQHKQHGKKIPKEIKSLSTICQEILGFSLSKELQCSDWSLRPLSEEQKTYAAMDAHCLLEIFNFFQAMVVKEGDTFDSTTEVSPYNVNLGLKEVLEEVEMCNQILRFKIPKAEDIVLATVASDLPPKITTVEVVSKSLCRNTMPMEETILKVVTKYGEKILLKESDRKPKASKRKGRKRSSVGLISNQKVSENSYNWQGPAPWDTSLSGDGFPKFLCDVMVEGLAKHLRCVGIDAAVPLSRKPESRDLIDQAHKEKRVILTRDVKLFRHKYLIKNQIYKVKSLLKNEQLLEVIETFELKISEDQLMSRCTKCNGMFIQKPLTTEEAIEAAKGFQKIPDCLFDKNLEFWQCQDCNQLYWEGTQYHNAVQKFIDVCKLNEEVPSS